MHVGVRSGVVGGRLLASALVLFGAAQLRCSSDENVLEPRQGEKDPCATIYEGQCGVACALDGDCAAGLHCGPDGSCTAACGPGASLCPPEQGCSNDGRCSGGGGGSSSGGTTGLDLDASMPSGGDQGLGGSGETCAEIELELGDVTPTVVLLIDQSGSMEDEDIEPGGPTRWQALKDALRGPDSVIAALEDKVRFGFVFYSNPADLDMPPEAGVCPILDRGGMDETLWPPVLNAFDAFEAYYEDLPTYPNTPTGESVRYTAADLASFDEPGPKYIVLATDGNPDHCADDKENNPDGVARQISVDEVQKAHDEFDITTFVISVGGDVAEDHLNDVANVGQGFPVDDPEDRFFLVTTQDMLGAAFEQIIGGVRSCTLTLNGEIDPAEADQGTVLLDGEPLPMDESNGWRVLDGTTIELVGDACAAIESGDHSLSARFPCDVVVTPPR
jgi:hypothetical protein